MNKVAKVSVLVAVLVFGLVLIYSAKGVLPVFAQVVTGNIANDFVSNSEDAGPTGPRTSTIITITDIGRDDGRGLPSDDEISASDLTITSGINSINVTSTETGVAGTFAVEISVQASSTPAEPFTIAAEDGDDIEVRYTGSGGTTRLIRTAPSNNRTLKVDGAGPTLDDFSPEDATTSNDSTQTLSVEVEDIGATLGDENAVRGVSALGNVFFSIGANDLPADEATALNDEETRWLVTLDVFDVVGTLTWRVTAKDVLGNRTVSDPVTVVVDVVPPEVESAITGHVADTSDDPIVDEAANNRRSILVLFSEDIDGDSIIRRGDNFQVLDENDRELTIDKAEHFDDIHVAGVTTSRAVYITLDGELSAADEPKVLVVRAIRDVAGNELTSDEVDADDGIAPDLSVLLVGTGEDGVVTTGRLTIRVTSDELSTNPEIEPDADLIGVSVTMINEEAAEALTLLGTLRDADDFDVEQDSRVWEWEYNFEDDESGLYNVFVRVTDGDNDAGAGLQDPDDEGELHDDAIVFEVDTGIPGVILTPEATDNPDTFIRLSFEGGVDPDGEDVLAEGDEYQEDSHSTVTVSSITITLEGETRGNAVAFSTINDMTFTVGPQNLPVGTHDITVAATDEAGNQAVFALDIEVTEREPFEFQLQPGWNLISLPGAPARADINEMIPSDHPINEVRTYSAVDAGFLVAIRDPMDGLFAGTLTMMDSKSAYLVRTTTFESLEVLIPRLSAGERLTPPTIDVFEGWNLVPVVDVTGEGEFGTVVDDYFAGVDPIKIYELDRDTGSLMTVAADVLELGQGYWVYFDDDDVLVP